jgi:GNAT superfamily N-acetyltransferase
MRKFHIADRIVLRHADRTQIPEIRVMQRRSLVMLGAAHYEPAVIDAFVTRIGTMDDAVIDEGHYFVAVSDAGEIMGSGGWSRREPGYDHARLVGEPDFAQPGIATVRSVFVDPACARCGVATSLMTHVERDAALHGVRLLRLMATLSGLEFYRRLGWRTESKKVIALGGELRFSCVSMSKPIAQGAIRVEPRTVGLESSYSDGCGRHGRPGTLRLQE